MYTHVAIVLLVGTANGSAGIEQQYLGGYAVYENETYVSDTASCDNPDTFCCQANNDTFGVDTTINDACIGSTGTIYHGNETHRNCQGTRACFHANIDVA